MATALESLEKAAHRLLEARDETKRTSGDLAEVSYRLEDEALEVADALDEVLDSVSRAVRVLEAVGA